MCWQPRMPRTHSYFQQLPTQNQPSLAHHFVGVVAVVLHAVLYQFLLVQIPGPTIRAHKR